MFYSIHESSVVGLTNLLYQLLIIVSIVVVKQFTHNSLIIVATIYGLSNLIIGLVYSFIFFKRYPYLTPKIALFDKNKTKDIMGIGLEFFIIQVSMIIIFTTDNIIITKLLGAKEVTSYNIMLRLFQVFITIFSFLLIPFWPLYTEAFTRKDKRWIKKTLRNFNLLFLVITLIVLIVLSKVDLLLNIWLGQELKYPKYLALFCALFVLIRIYGDIYMCFLNGISKIRLQLCLYLIGAIANIPLSIYFVKDWGLGSSGVLLATNICILPFIIVLPIQTYKILKSMD